MRGRCASGRWAGDDKLNGATLFHDEMYESYTREVKTLQAWFQKR